MNPLLRWLTSPEWAHVVAALLHSLWQGAIVALALAVLMRRLTNPLTRYRCALGALGVIGIAGIVTWAVLNAPNSAPQSNPAPASEPTAPAITAAAFDSNPTDKVVVLGQMTRPEAQTNWTAWLALTWMAGALVMLLRAGVKVAGAEKLRRSCQPLADEHIALLVTEACRAVGLARKIRVAVTHKLTSPAVVGVIVPTLILPLSLFTTLTPTQIQFVLLHELAHIRRGDYLANLFQLFAEALLFFNPAVWWISHQIRREREACCDALAIELSGAPADYARTLVRVAENILQPAPAAAPAFGDDGREPSSLADRVQRLLVPGYRPALRLTWRAISLSLVLGLGLLILSAGATKLAMAQIVKPSGEVHVTTNTTSQPLEISAGHITVNLNSGELIASNQVQAIINGQFTNTEALRIKLSPIEHAYRVVTNFSELESPQANISIPHSIAPSTTNLGLDNGLPQTYVSVLNADHRLNSIRLAEIKFDHQPLHEVIRELTQKAKQGDPERIGVEFILAPDRTGIDPATGLPLASVSEEMNSVVVTSRYRMTGPLRYILDSIVSCADRPIKYTFTNNIVRFSRRAATESEPLFTREYDLPARTFYGKILTNLTPAVINRTASSNLAPMALQGFRNWLSGWGVNMDPTQGKSLYYKDRKGALLVRATLADLDIIETAIVNLNHPATDLVTRTFNVVPQKLVEAIEATAPQFKPVTPTNVTAGLRALFLTAGVDLALPKSIYYNDRSGGLFVRATKEDLDTIESLLQVIGQQPPQVNIKAVFVEIPFGNSLPKELARILGPITSANATNFTGILTTPQFKVILRAVEASAAAKIVAMPQVTTLSGRQAQIQVTDVKTIVSGMTAVVTNGMTNLVYQSQPMPFGPVLDILPTVSGDGYTIQMTLSPTITEFLGYEDAKKLKLSSPDDKGTLPLPIIRARQMTTSASVWDGQTIVLGNFSDQMLDAPTDLKGAPKGSAKRQSKQLLVFVTPTIIDPAGNPANKDMGIPSRLVPGP